VAGYRGLIIYFADKLLTCSAFINRHFQMSSMKNLFLFLLISSALLFSCNSDNSKKEQAEKESYEATKENLLKKEQKLPQQFLLVNGYNRKNIFGQTVVKGVISNKATVATFKDITLKLSFFSRTKALLETDKETIFETVDPGKSKNFKTKYFAPKGTDSVALEILGAKVVEEESDK
jgi:hypothetical protein